MTRRSAAATEAARRFWARSAGNGSPEDVIATTGRVCLQLQAGLSRWVGAGGYRALLDRALEQTRAEHPALNKLSCYNGDEKAAAATVQSAAAAVQSHGAVQVTAGMVTMVATLIDLLGRIIGEEMALQLVVQAGTPSARKTSIEMQGEGDG